MARIDRRALWRAEWSSLVRLASWERLRVGPGPETVARRGRLVEALIRIMDIRYVTSLCETPARASSAP